MRQVAARHDTLLDGIIIGHHGHRVKERGEGDSVFATFADPADAVAAALAIQQAVLAEPWPDKTPIKVRMGLHTGTGQFRDGDYYGTDVNRCARIRGLAHGGQVLLSLATAALVRRKLPAGASLRSLGEQALKGLADPEEVFQLCHPELPAEFPPLQLSAAPYMFVAHARADRALVERLSADLEARGITSWVDAHSLAPGTPNWEQALREAIRDARAVLLIASPNTRASRYVLDELRIAELYRRPVYPLWVSGREWMECVPIGWGSAQRLDARGPAYDGALRELMALLHQAVRQVVAPAFTPHNPLADALGPSGEERAAFIAPARAVGAPVADTPLEQPGAFAPLLRRHRRDAGLTQEALAERAGISLRAVSDLERGIYRTPHRDTVALLAQALGLTQQETAFLEASVVRLRGPASPPDGRSAGDQPPLPVLPPPVEQLSPFVAGPPIVHPARFFGHERILKRLFALWRLPPFQNAALIGPRRSGKTSLLLYLRSITTTSPDRLRPGQRRDWLAAPESYRWIYVDFQDPRLGSQDGLLTYLLGQMGQPAPSPCTMEHFLDSTADQLRTPTVVLLDEIGVALHRYAELDDAFWEGLRSLASTQGGGRLAFVLAAHESPTDLAAHSGHSSPFFNLFAYTATVGPLTEAEARDLVASAPLPFAPADVDWIVAQSGCWPLLLQILCRERLHALQEDEADDAWREDGMQQMAPFRYLLDGL
jgi:transcriptional regulator with XRE-family HTH domain